MFQHVLFERGQPESESHNKHCFSHHHEDDRTSVTFLLYPPTLGHFVLRIYGIPEALIDVEQPSNLELLASFLIKCTRVSHKVPAWPVSNIPWGLTGDFYNLGLKMVIDDASKWSGCRILLKVGSKSMFKFVHQHWPIMSSVTLFDKQVGQRRTRRGFPQ